MTLIIQMESIKQKVLNQKNEEIFKDYMIKVEAIQNIDQNNNLWYEQNALKRLVKMENMD